MSQQIKSAEERFFNKVEKTKTCWNWKASKNRGGYGRFWVDGRNSMAHHFLTPPPVGRLALHRCDNPGCVRPRHIFFGTQQDNIDDMIKKGRAINRRVGWEAMMKVRKTASGASNGRAKLSKYQVRVIRQFPVSHGSMAILARRFGVSHQSIRKVINKESWIESARDSKK